MFWGILMLLGTGICSATKRPQHGFITSPNYPKTYPNNNHSSWEVLVPEGYHVSLRFLAFDMEPSDGCTYDYVKVWEGKKDIGRFCGPVKSRDHPGHRLVVSKGNRIKVEFQSDFSNEENGTTIMYRGFQAFYKAVDTNECELPNDNTVSWSPPCQHVCHNYIGGYACSCLPGYKLQSDQRSCKVECSNELFTEESGYISSPGYPHPYPPNLNCKYTIRLEQGLLISLSFMEEFDIDDHPRALCPYDTLKVLAGGSLLKSYCGRSSPGVVRTQKNMVELVFETDDSGDSKGWKLHYTAKAVKCPTPVTLDEFSIIDPVQKEYKMRDYIVVSCLNGYKLMENGKELLTFTSLCQKDGTWHRPMPRCEIVSCERPNNLRNGQFRFLSETNRLTYLSSITYSCNEPYYKMVTNTGSATFTCSGSREWEDENEGLLLPICVPVCGKPSNPVTRFTSRILNGDIAAAGNFPWQVFLQSSGDGAGVLIGERWVLTAAHVLRPKTSSNANVDATTLRVFVGETNRDDLIKSAHLRVKAFHVHPNYTTDNHDNDIALIQLQDPATMSDKVSPACLPESDADVFYEVGRLGYVSGLGLMEEGKFATDLHYVSLPMVQRDKCQKHLIQKQREKFGDKEVFTDNMFCAGFPQSSTVQKDSCQGDSGGAIAVPYKDTWVAAGLVSWGIGCGRGYGYYTKVNMYIDWINSFISR